MDTNAQTPEAHETKSRGPVGRRGIITAAVVVTALIAVASTAIIVANRSDSEPAGAPDTVPPTTVTTPTTTSTTESESEPEPPPPSPEPVIFDAPAHPPVFDDGDETIRTLIYGDSLTQEANRDIQDFVPASREVTVHPRFGGAPCNALERIEDDWTATDPEVLVIAFSGNGGDFLTRCMDELEPAEVAARYRSDLDALIDFAVARDADVALVMSPAAGDGETEPRWSAVRQMLRELSADRGIPLVDSNPTIAPGEIFTETMPCMDSEDCDEVVVRSRDEVHLCPDGTGMTCPDGGSGLIRFAFALLEAARLAATPSN